MCNRTRAERWAAAVLEAQSGFDKLAALKDEYEAWRDNLPKGLDQSPVAEKLDAILDMEWGAVESFLSDAGVADLPLGFGRD